MWFIPNSKQTTLTHRLRERLRAAQILRHNIGLYRLMPTHLRMATAAYRLTCSEEATFSEAFGEPMPRHLITAVHLERDLWLAILDTLEHATHAEYDHIVPSLRQDLATLAFLIALEQEMHASPLTISFQRRLASIGAR